MSNLPSLKRRIKTGKNISQITKAMEMVAASKMRRAQEMALSSRPYSEKLDEVISNLATRVKIYDHPLLAKRKEIKNIAVLLVSTNRGLCGSLNTNLFRAVSDWQATNGSGANTTFITVGKRARGFVARSSSPLLAEFATLPEYPTFESIRPVAKLLLDGFVEHTFDKVVVVYTRFINTLSQETTVRELLPSVHQASSTPSLQRDYLFEPSPRALLDWVLPYRFELLLYQTILEAKASEHSARMVSMKSAHDNAKDLVGSLTIDYNRERQSVVTSALLDVTTARIALGE